MSDLALILLIITLALTSPIWICFGFILIAVACAGIVEIFTQFFKIFQRKR